MTPPDGVGSAETWRVVGDVHGIQFTHGAFHFHGGNTNAVTDPFRCQCVCTTQEDSGVTGTDDFLPPVIRISVPHLAYVLEEHGNRATSGSDRGTLFLKVRDIARAIGKLIEDEFHFRWQASALTIAVCIADQLDE